MHSAGAVDGKHTVANGADYHQSVVGQHGTIHLRSLQRCVDTRWNWFDAPIVISAEDAGIFREEYGRAVVVAQGAYDIVVVDLRSRD